MLMDVYDMWEGDSKAICDDLAKKHSFFDNNVAYCFLAI
jgi:hypothetical protein